MKLFSWLMARYYDKFMQDAELKCLKDWRFALLGALSGRVVEIGCGIGDRLLPIPEYNQLTNASV